MNSNLERRVNKAESVVCIKRTSSVIIKFGDCWLIGSWMDRFITSMLPRQSTFPSHEGRWKENFLRFADQAVFKGYRTLMNEVLCSDPPIHLHYSTSS